MEHASALARHPAPLLGRRRRAAARHGAHRALAGAPGRGKILEAAARGTGGRRPRLRDRQPGRAGGAVGTQGYLLLRLAGRRRRQQRRRDVSGPEPVSRRLRAEDDRAHQQCAAAHRPDPCARGRERHRLAGAHHRGCRGRFRRQPECLRAHQGDDSRRRGRRALRGSALLREEMRPHGRQGAGAHRRSHQQAGGGTPGRRRVGRADHRDRAHRRGGREPADLRSRFARPAVPDRTSAAPKGSST